MCDKHYICITMECVTSRHVVGYVKSLTDKMNTPLNKEFLPSSINKIVSSQNALTPYPLPTIQYESIAHIPITVTDEQLEVKRWGS